MLESTGGRGAIYHLAGEAMPTPDEVFGPPSRISAASSPVLAGSSPILEGSSPILAPSSPLLEGKRDANDYLTADQLTLAFPTTPTHERQAYCASSALSA